VYRQLTAGINAGLVLSRLNNELPEEYEKLNDIHFITQIVLAPPFIIYPKKNTRSGLFEEVSFNPLDNIQVEKDHFFCYPAKVGESLTFVYFHRDFMNHGVSLCNLFELAKPEEYKNKKPDIVLVFGARLKDNIKETVFYHDKPNDLMVGYVSNTDEVDYFGYMKKMILTLHNVRMINHNHLPIHGAMVNVTLKTGRTANIAIIGDSGAGKSESLEAFRKLSDKYLKEIKIIFDDMGTFKIENNNIVGYGTEIGAFVRLDDLEMGYSFEQMDRAIFMNPHRVNARLLLPVSSFDVISKGYTVDYLLYANNFEDKKSTLTLFDNKEDAVQVFVKGMRKAKGTTSESGVVESYFANPFGPVQRQEQTNIIINDVFTKLFDNSIPVGQIYTRLAVEGYEQKGPEKAAKQLFELIKNN
jgi:energy-coupling factor transporter ATP-binding protein EcfA2